MEWPLLDAIEQGGRGAVVRATRPQSFTRGSSLWREGDPSDGLHLVVSGYIAIETATPGGDVTLLNVLTTGSTVGELSLTDEVPASRSASATALGPVETRMLSARAFAEVRDTFPGVERWLSLLLAERVRALSRRVSDLMFLPLEQRLARALDELTEVYAVRGAAGPVMIPLTQDALASYVGGTRPTVNRELRRLVGASVIELGRGKVTVLDRPTLHEIADGPAATRRS